MIECTEIGWPTGAFEGEDYFVTRHFLVFGDDVAAFKEEIVNEPLSGAPNAKVVSFIDPVSQSGDGYSEIGVLYRVPQEFGSRYSEAKTCQPSGTKSNS